MTFSGTVYQTVEAIPRPAILVVTERGHVSEQSIELVNHESHAARDHERESSPRSFCDPCRDNRGGKAISADVDARWQGRRRSRRRTDSIVVKTSSQSTPVVRILANTFVREHVYTFPDAIDFGAVPLSVLETDPALIQKLARP